MPVLKSFTLLVVLVLAYPVYSQQDADEAWPDDFEQSWQEDDQELEEDSNWVTRGSIDLGAGFFRGASPANKSQSLAEARTQLDISGYWGESFISAKFEMLTDGVDDNTVQFLTRELYIDLPLGDSLNFRIGQQVLTWGTGDFVFLNDHFPKNWQAMFSGRDDDYLKAPSTSIKASHYGRWFNTDLVWTPDFSADTFISGERFGFYNPALGQVSAAPRLASAEPKSKLSNGQLSLRLSKTLAGVEYALYGYRGFYTQPKGFDSQNQVYTFPALNSYGASLRSPLAKGIASFELAYLDSRWDRSGRNPWLPNSQWKFLLAYEQELFRNFTAGVQLYTEKTEDFSAQKLTAIEPRQLDNKWHHNMSLRLNYLSHQQKMTWSLFAFYSPDNRDFYLKPKLSYRHDDHWLFVLGANEFGGGEQHHQWGQFEVSSNIYARIKYTF